ncbi:alpha/beta hydrolase [Luteolibacter soli]|uniref:Alpha/beta hydrolase n=1 Tax=Luteolibacter soli TaxID=3135280 RepID=A0ABU9AXW6_9BACT
MVKLLLFCLSLMLATHAPAKVVRDLPYAGKGSGPLRTLDLHTPDEKREKPRPVFILIHGGGWRVGDKSNGHFAEPKTQWLLDAGYDVASINYRLSPAVEHPAHVEDACKAIAWVQGHAAEFGGDPQRIYLLGHSAGAHLAALAAVDVERLKAAGADPAGIMGVVLLDGAGYDIPLEYPSLREGSVMQKMYRDAFTSDPEKQRNASPVYRVTVKPPPFLILHTTRRLDSPRQSKLLAEALREKGGTVEVVPVPGKNHGTINADCGKPGDPVTVAIERFLAPKGK